MDSGDSDVSNEENRLLLEEEEEEVFSDQNENENEDDYPQTSPNNNKSLNNNNNNNNNANANPNVCTLHRRSLQGVLVHVSKNSYPRGNFKRYKFTTIEKLLNDSMNLLALNDQAKKVFKEDGTKLENGDEVTKDMKLYISSGEKFNFGIPSPRKPSPTATKKDVNVDNENGEEEEKKEKAENLGEVTVKKTKAEILLEKKQKRLESEALSFNRALMLSPRTTEEAFHEATASVYSQLLENQKRRLPNWYSVQFIHDETQQAMLIQTLINQKICPSTNDIIPEVDSYILDLLKALSLNDVKFVITGPRQSGKTTLLYSLITKLSKKLQVSEEALSYLIFPLNFELQTLELSNHFSLLRIFLVTVFDSLEYCCFTILPYLQQLRQWFITSVFNNSPAMIQFPAQISQITSVNVPSLQNLAKSLNSALRGKGPQGLQNFIQAVCSFPEQFAKAIGLRGALFVLDSFEYCDFFFNPNETNFPESLRPVSFSQILCNELSKSLYIVSLQDERHFMECFSCNDAALIDMEGILRDLQSSTEIIVMKPPLRLAIDECLGCPGYISKFDKLCNFVRTMQVNASTLSHYASLKTSSDMARAKLVKQEIARFCQLLFYGGSTLINKDLLNSILDEEYLFVKIVDHADDEEEEEEEGNEKKKGKGKDGKANHADVGSTGTTGNNLDGPENVLVNA